MIECLFLGDSIAIGARVHAPRCEVIAENGVTSKRFNQVYEPVPAKSVIISLGSNDHRQIKTREEIEMLRSKVTGKVYWILPAIKPDVQKIVKEVALANDDIIITIPDLQRDGVHPTAKGYKEMLKEIK